MNLVYTKLTSHEEKTAIVSFVAVLFFHQKSYTQFIHVSEVSEDCEAYAEESKGVYIHETFSLSLVD